MTDTAMSTCELTGDSPYLAALAALRQFVPEAEGIRTAAETLEAELTKHEFNRDPALFQHLGLLREATSGIDTHVQGARRELEKHQGGQEYHGTGQDAHDTGFRAGGGS